MLPSRATTCDDWSERHVFAPYGAQAPSCRARVIDWLEFSSLPSTTLHSYLPGESRAPKSFSGAITMVGAERRLRRSLPKHIEIAHILTEASLLSRGAVENRIISIADKSIFELDDAVFETAGTESRYSNGWRAGKATRLASSVNRVIAGNTYLGAWAAELCDDVVVIPSCVDPTRYRVKESYELKDPPCIGWIGSQTTENHLLMIAPALREINARTGARVRLIGAPYGPADDVLKGFIDRVPWTRAGAPNQLADMDVGIMPLPDNPFTRGKCAYKLLQYAAAGLPLVGSPVGANAAVLGDLGGLAPPAHDDWVDALLAACDSTADARRVKGRAARAHVASHYSYESWAPTWRRAIWAGEQCSADHPGREDEAKEMLSGDSAANV